VLLTPIAQLHTLTGLYRFALKWGLVRGEDPRHTRERLRHRYGNPALPERSTATSLVHVPDSASRVATTARVAVAPCGPVAVLLRV
jgi:hypothetical protein